MPIYALGALTPDIHPDAYIHPDAVVIGDVRVGALSSVWPCAVLRGDGGAITVGERTSIQDGSVIHTTPESPTQVGNDCTIGHQVHLEGCLVEPALKGIKPGDRCQFERTGYFCADPDSIPDKPVFNRTVTLRDTWAKIEKAMKA